ncbi:(2Fe-2S)-binding protein [Ammoniphilus sp. 3BR4]|uniref:(2Fe-2S)-binding protein n=1 Tax=Ammoniphilus sp. 3BR4 TaxID=3158265 RepID=UPI003465EE43
MRLTNWQATQPTDGDRHVWRDQVIRNIFAGNIAKIWRSICKAADIPIAVLWENTAIYVYWLYEKRMGEGASEQQKVRIHEDFQYLLHEAPASLFGDTENPLKKYNSPKCTISTSDQPVRIRKTCCFYYKVSSSENYCSTCPKVKR